MQTVIAYIICQDNKSITIRNENLWSPSLSLRIEKEIAKEKADNPQNPRIYYETTVNSSHPNRLNLIPVTKTEAKIGVILGKSYITLLDADAKIIMLETATQKGLNVTVGLHEDNDRPRFVRHYHYMIGFIPLNELPKAHSFFIL